MQQMRSTEEMALQAKTRTKLTCKNRHSHTTLAKTQHTHTLVPHTYYKKGGGILLQVLYYLESHCFDRENLNISDLATVYENSQFS